MNTRCLPIILLITVPAAWSASGWDDHFSQGESLQQAGRYEQAAVEFQAALSEAERENPDDVRVPVTWNNLGVVCRALGQTHDSERYYRLAIAYYEKHAGLEPSLATSLENLAALDLTTGQISKAEALYRRSSEIRRRVSRPDDPNLGESLHGLARLEHARHRYVQAEAYYREALAIEEKAFGAMAPRIAPTLHNFAALLADTGRKTEAHTAYERVLAIYRTSAPGRPEEAIVLRSLAELDAAAGLTSRADQEFQSAISICAASLPSDHPETGAILQAYGMFLRSNRRTGEARTVLARANGILGKSARESGEALVVDAGEWK